MLSDMDCDLCNAFPVISPLFFLEAWTGNTGQLIDYLKRSSWRRRPIWKTLITYEKKKNSGFWHLVVNSAP